MGLSPFGRSSGSSWVSNPLNPNPSNFRILDLDLVGKYIIATVYYPNCTNYEGRKVIVFKNMSTSDIRNLRSLDPHFLENGNIVARFAPTSEGYALARKMCLS